MFERLSQKGFLQSMQQQMRRAINQELGQSRETNDFIEREVQTEDNGISIKETNDLKWDSLAKVSSIANWEKQLRYELQIDKEIQMRELERQRERLLTESRELQERDKSLRIKLDAREKRVRQREEELNTSLQELNDKLDEVTAKEHTIDTIVNEKIKNELKDEIEKLKKKFNELEINKIELNKRENKVKEVEQRLYSQVKIVKEKIDNKKLLDMELIKTRKDLEIARKENELMKERVDSMDDYQMTKFENKSLKNELNIVKESLENKLTEFETEKQKFEKLIKERDEKVLKLTIDLRKCEQQILLMKQKHQGDIDQFDNKLIQLDNQFKQSKLVTKQLQYKNQLLSKQVLESRNERQQSVKIDDIIHNNNIINNNENEMNGHNYGCYICDESVKALEETSFDFMLTQRISSEMNDWFSGQQNINLQTLKTNVSTPPHHKNEVPFNDNSQAIQSHNHKTCAKHTVKDNSNIGNSLQTSDDKDIKSIYNENNNTLKYSISNVNNNNNKEKVEKSTQNKVNDNNISNSEVNDW
ncbi:putative uncharacterized protein DDB_G0286901 [Oppia nitens]|uniref:putative uncharacterized protein DDB_G0286901 n=1 Tax=Oppia nitens TaxID=1686743 RepID=UPI0023DCD9FB|nr:putative uncharacterized protein DDB_G0286901 [Oppia nitens]